MMSEETTPRLFSSASFDLFLSEHRLMGSRCTSCAATYLPPRAICPACQSDQMEWLQASGQGQLAAFTVIYSGPTFMVEQGFDRKNPYISGIVTLAEGPSISARITGLDPLKPEEIRIGSPLNVDFIDTGTGETRQTALAFRAA